MTPEEFNRKTDKIGNVFIGIGMAITAIFVMINVYYYFAHGINTFN